MIKLSQRDSRWASTKIGYSSITVGRYGCTLTCISMLSDYFGCFLDPKRLASEILKFTKDGLILWGSVTSKIPCMEFEKRLYKRDDAEIDLSLKDPKKAVILQVELYHWVVALRKLPLGVYLIADPWTGTVRLSTAYKNISGSAHFLKK